jgi:heme/copper-type cytochrome/quinol oxidase subunit 3
MATGLLETARPPARRPTNGHVGPPGPPRGGDDWRPEPAPRGPLDNLRVAILFFIGAESMFFAALISCLFVLRASLPVWPPPLQPRLPIGVTTANTVVLLASSVAMILAARALRRLDRRDLVRWLTVAAALGTLFLVVQGSEWVGLVRHGLTLSSSTYGTTFYTLIGTHALHVAGALVWLVATVALAGAARSGTNRGPLVRGCALYWHFVVAMWLVLFVAVYVV